MYWAGGSQNINVLDTITATRGREKLNNLGRYFSNVDIVNVNFEQTFDCRYWTTFRWLHVCTMQIYAVLKINIVILFIRAGLTPQLLRQSDRFTWLHNCHLSNYYLLYYSAETAFWFTGNNIFVLQYSVLRCRVVACRKCKQFSRSQLCCTLGVGGIIIICIYGDVH